MPSLSDEIESVAKRFDELTDEIEIPELLALSEELGKASERASQMQSTIRRLEDNLYSMQDRIRREERGRDPRDLRREEQYRRDMLDAQRYGVVTYNNSSLSPVITGV